MHQQIRPSLAFGEGRGNQQQRLGQLLQFKIRCGGLRRERQREINPAKSFYRLLDIARLLIGVGQREFSIGSHGRTVFFQQFNRACGISGRHHGVGGNDLRIAGEERFWMPQGEILRSRQRIF